MVDWADTSFEPETISYGSDLRFFRMSKKWPEKPFEDRKFQLGGKERVALLEDMVYHCWIHRFSERFMGSKVNGTRRCTLGNLGSCAACEHYESAPDKIVNGQNKKHGEARCGRRQQQFGVNLLVYKTDLEGTLLTPEGQAIILDDQKGPVLADGTPAQFEYEVFLWRMSADKFSDIRQIKQGWTTLKNNDLLFQLAPGKDEKFQDFSPTVLPKCAWRVLGAAPGRADEAKAILEYYKENRYDVSRILGKEHTREEMLGFIGLPGGVTPGGGGQMAEQPDSADIAQRIEDELAALPSELAAPTPVPAPEPTATAESPAPPPQAETPTPQPQPVPQQEGAVDFDSILAN